jgi:hypothetical protein
MMNIELLLNSMQAEEMSKKEVFLWLDGENFTHSNAKKKSLKQVEFKETNKRFVETS